MPPDERPKCGTCDDIGWVDDPSACGDLEHCSPVVQCPDCDQWRDDDSTLAVHVADWMPDDMVLLYAPPEHDDPDPDASLPRRAAIIRLAVDPQPKEVTDAVG